MCFKPNSGRIAQLERFQGRFLDRFIIEIGDMYCECSTKHFQPLDIDRFMRDLFSRTERKSPKKPRRTLFVDDSVTSRPMTNRTG
ncbi:MAG: hypothetical protein AAFY84_17970 [Pseudomonadota bacterium]